MRLSKFILCVVIITSISLLYVHMQVEIFKLAYEARNKENRIEDLLAKRENLMYNINALKSTQHIGDTLFSKDWDFQFPSEQQVVQLAVSREIGREISFYGIKPKTENKTILYSLFGLKSQAEAKPIK